MGAFDKIERGVEHAVDSVFSRAFRSDLKPVEIASGIKKSMDDRSAALSRDRVIAPNEFTISLSESDYAKLQDWGEEELSSELVSVATQYAREQRYTFLGPISIDFRKKSSLPRGKITVRGISRKGAAAPATGSEASEQTPIIDVDGESYILTGAVTVIGRGSGSDIVVDDPGVSRRHLEISLTPGGVIAKDLGSTNGTFVEGHRISSATLLDGNTITIGNTTIMFWTSPEPA